MVLNTGPLDWESSALTTKPLLQKPPLFLCRLSTVNVESSCLSTRSNPNCKGITVMSCHYSQSKGNLLKQRPAIIDIKSPWCLQIVMINGRHQECMPINYLQTINHYTQLDEYPLPHIHEHINKLTKNYVWHH